MSSSHPVTPAHLSRRATIYVRQSTPHQVMTHLESRRLQEAMREHARRLGWSDERIDVVDLDTGRSAASVEGRDAYKNLLSEVALGNVGIVLSYDSARLSRNCSDWYPLLDVCALKGCLVADRDGVYDPATVNGRLLLGMKGILSEVELHTIRGRMTAGLQAKARRGELEQVLPVGLVREEDGRVVKDPDQSIQRAIELVFQTFIERKSVFKVVNAFRQNGVQIPRRIYNAETVWSAPSVSKILKFLKNPAYTGTFVYGRKDSTQHRGPDGRKRPKPRKREDWLVVLHDRFPAYVSWETFERIQAILADNYAEYQRRMSRGVPREGAALLQGIVYCGTCGRKVATKYKEGARYVCQSRHTNATEPPCFHVPGEPVDTCVVETFFQALDPVELDLYERAMSARNKADAAVEMVQQQELQRLQYQADLARRRYDRADPDNRLVTAELERRWETALQALGDASARFEEANRARTRVIPLSIPRELRAAFTALGTSLPGAWKGSTMTHAQKKALLRCLIDKVVLRRAPERREVVSIRVVWRGGAVTEREVPIRIARLTDLSTHAALEEAVLALAREGHGDAQIATLLTEQGFRSAWKERLPVEVVRQIRRRHPELARKGGWAPCPAGLLNVRQLADRVEVHPVWLFAAIRRGAVPAQQHPVLHRYVFPDRPDVVDAIRRLRSGEVSCLPETIFSVE